MDELIRKVIHRSYVENRPQGEILKEELLKIEKAQGTTDQSKSPEHDKNIN